MNTYKRQQPISFSMQTPSDSTPPSDEDIPTPFPKSFSSSSPPKESSPQPIRSHPFLDPPPKMSSISFSLAPSPLKPMSFPKLSAPSPLQPMSLPKSFNPKPKPMMLPQSFTYKPPPKSRSLTPKPISFSSFKKQSQNKRNRIFINKDNNQRDSLSPSQSPSSDSDSGQESNTESSDSELEIIQTPKPISIPISFGNNKNNKKRFNRNYISQNPIQKKRKLNQQNTVDTIDLCNDSSDDDRITPLRHIDNPKTIQLLKDVHDYGTESSDIDIEDKEVLLYGISIGTHSHLWTPGAVSGDDSDSLRQRPKIVFNKYKASMDVYLNSTHNEYVPVIIEANNIGNLIIPQDPSYFTCTEMVSRGQYINVLFLVLKKPLHAYGWLTPHFCPTNEYYNAKDSRQAFITIYIDAESLNQLQSIVLTRHPCNLVDRFVAKLKNSDKHEMLRLTHMDEIIHQQWKQINIKKTHENENIDECQNGKLENDEDEDMDFKSNDKNEESDSGSSLSSQFSSSEFANKNNNYKMKLTDYKLYVKNTEFIAKPHHENSLLYVMNKSDPYYQDVKCYWIFPAQHGHIKKEYIIRKTDMNKLIDNEWLNDDIINFGVKYIYTAWPCYLKQKVYVFSSYFYTSISKALNKCDKLEDINDKMRKDVLKQTKSFANVFDRKYILIPICDNHHWELMIVYNINMVWNNRCNNGICKCYLIVLDSLNGTKVIHKGMFDKCKIWLNVLAQNNGYNGKLFRNENVITNCIKIPKQPNSIDCGCFLLRNIYQFGRENGRFDVKVSSLKHWYSVNDGVKYRSIILDVMNGLANEQKKYIIDMYKKDKINKRNKKKQKAKRHGH